MKNALILAAAMFLSACGTAMHAPQLAAPTSIVAPQPIAGNSGAYMSPFAEDGTVAPWVEKGKSARAGSSVGGFLGAQAGQKMAEQIPFIGGLIGQKVGETAGRAVALQMVGGEEFIRANSDISFRTVQDLAVYMYAKNSMHKDYAEALALTQEIYPDLKTAYYPAIINASRAARQGAAMHIKLIAGACVALLLAGCAAPPNLNNTAGRRVMCQDVTTASPTTAGVGVESQDIVSMTDRMVRDINPAIAGRSTPPRIIIDPAYFANESSSRINKNTITDRLRIELTRAAQGRLVFVARHYGDMVAKEREAKRDGARDSGTIRSTKAVAGGDFRLGGRITSLDAMQNSSGTVSRYHQITFELIDLEYETIAWSGLYEFRKEAQDDILYR